MNKFSDIQQVISFLQEHGQLARVKKHVHPKYELAGVAKAYEGQSAILFEHPISHHEVPILTGLYWNREILGSLFGVKKEEVPFIMSQAIDQWKKDPQSPIIVNEGPANEVVVTENIDLLEELPVPTIALKETHPYLNSSVVIAKDPETGVRNASIHRFMVTGRNRLTMQLDRGRHLRDYYERAEKMGKPLEITINNGVSPAVHFASVTPSSAISLAEDELGVANLLLGEPLALLRSQTVQVEGIAEAQYIIEAEILPHTREPEGPAAEVTGYYAQLDNRWTVHVKAITRRHRPIFHTIIPGIEVYNAVGIMAEASLFHQVSSMVPGVKRVFLPYGGCGFYHAVVQIEKKTEGMPKQAILATLAAFPSLRRVTVVDEDVDIYDPIDVEWAIATRHDPERDMMFVRDTVGHELNPMVRDGIGTKVGIDATAPTPRPWKFQRTDFQKVDLQDYQIE